MATGLKEVHFVMHKATTRDNNTVKPRNVLSKAIVLEHECSSSLTLKTNDKNLTGGSSALQMARAIRPAFLTERIQIDDVI